MRRLVPVTFLLVLGACGHARLINRTQYGGAFALEGDRNKAMEDAHQQMASHCRGPYTIVAEGEQVVGTDTGQTNETYVTREGTVVNQGGSSTRQATEWRVQYQCGSNTQVPSQPSPYAPPPGPPGMPPPDPNAPPPPPPGKY